MRIHGHSNLREDSDILIDQLRAIDNERLAQGPLLKLSEVQMRRINRALCEVLELEAE